MRLRLLLLPLALWVTPATSQDRPPLVAVTGNFLHDLCEQNPSAALSFSVGVVNTIEALERILDERTPPYCVPSGMTADQLSDMVCKSIADHPERRHKNASMLVYGAFIEGFPC